MLTTPIGPTVELVLNSGSLEVNADKAPELSDQRLRLNTFELINICQVRSPKLSITQYSLQLQGLHDMIIQNLARFPQSLRIVMGRIYQEVERRFPDQGYNVVSSFIFLRFLCPSLLSPKKAGLIDLNPDRPRLRTLVLVSKLLQVKTCQPCVLFSPAEPSRSPMEPAKTLTSRIPPMMNVPSLSKITQSLW